MAQTQTNTIDNRYSFYRLLEEYKVVVPIIQRDYAQGRDDAKTEEIRTEFLDSLYDYLSDGDTHDLDFVYGTLEESEPKKSFIPLDGQQRLTTLFLLHWYLMQRVLHKNDNESNALKLKVVLKDQTSLEVSKSMFSYRTRQTSTDFCDKLVDVNLDFDHLENKEVEQEDGKKKKVPSVAATIRNYNWFASKWDFDPTIQSMLTMLDAIHEKFKDADHVKFLGRLLDMTKPAIAFVYMDLDEYKLSDDLYIQMNSRGKPLTPFENFKAKFEQYIGDIMVHDPKKRKEEYKNLDVSILNEIDKQVQSNYTQGNSTIDSVKKYFSHNIDTKWTHLFWRYCIDELNDPKNADPDKLEKVLTGILDKKMANFIRVILTFQYAVEGNDSKAIIGGVLQNEKNAYISFAQYEKNKILSPGSVEYLISALDILSNGNNKIAIINPNSKYFNEKEVFESIINHGLVEANYADLIRFHAYLKYIIYFGKSNPLLLDEWMRFVYNISDLTNTRTDGQDDFAHAIKSVTDLLNEMKQVGCQSVLKHLAGKDNAFKMAHFLAQAKEEVIKAHLMCRPLVNGVNWTDFILDLEPHPYFNGQIGFILEFSGIVDHFMLYNGFDGWDAAEEKTYYDNFVRNGKIASELFKDGYEKRVLATDALLERAAMAFNWRYFLGKHNAESIFPIAGRANLLCSTQGGDNVRRDFSWRKMLHINTNDAFRHVPIYELFRHLDENDVKGSLESIIKDANCRLSWVDAFVRYTSNMKLCKNGFTYFWDNRCMLLPNKNYGKDDAELFTYTIWEKGINSLPVNNKFVLSYKYANFNQECYPHIMCRFTFDEQEYAIRVMTVAENWEFKNYEFQFENINDQLMPIPAKLIGVLQPLGFSKASGSTEQWTLLSKAITYDDDARVKAELQNMMTQLLTVI